MKWLYAFCYIYAALMLIQARINWLTQKRISKLKLEMDLRDPSTPCPACGVRGQHRHPKADEVPTEGDPEKLKAMMRFGGYTGKPSDGTPPPKTAGTMSPVRPA